MNLVRHYLSRRGARVAAALGAAALLVTGATWQGFAADTNAPPAAGAPPAAVIAQAPAAQASNSSRALIGGRESYSDIVKLVAPGVVTVRVEGRARMAPTGFEDDDQMRRFFEQFGVPFGDGPRGPRTPRSFRQRGLGSGVIVTGDGYVLTNNHVVDSAENIEVELTDGRSFKAKLVGADKPSDLALLKLEASGLPMVPLGNSDAVEVGDVVLAVGNPLNVGQTVTMGIISAKGRSTARGEGSYEDFLQTDAPINHGNSGGALVNLKGELVGINSQILSGSDGNIGIGFAIPANMARRVMDDLRRDGRVRRAQLGVSIQPVTPDMAESLGLKEARGAIVNSVTPGSAAERAGITRGDVLKSFNGQPVRDINSLRNRVAEAGPGSNADVVIVRDGSERTLTVKLDEVSRGQAARSREESSDTDGKTALGVSVAPLTPELAARAELPRDSKGLVVQQVNPDSRAADAGIEEGDVILEVNRQAVQSPDDLRSALRKAPERPVLLLVARDGRQIFVTVRPS